jgi:hypothetical protein
MAKDKPPTMSYLVPLERNLRHNLNSSIQFFISRAENTRGSYLFPQKTPKEGLCRIGIPQAFDFARDFENLGRDGNMGPLASTCLPI